MAGAVSCCFISVGHWTSLNLPKFVFSRNDDGSYHITNWHHLNQVPHERYLQVSNGRPVLADSRSKCHLYRGKGSDNYVYVFDINPSSH